MFITKCVLVYIEPKLSSQLIEWAGKHFLTSVFLNYEPVSHVVITCYSWSEKNLIVVDNIVK